MFVRGILFEKRNDQRRKTTFIYRQVSSGRPQNGIEFDLNQMEKRNKKKKKPDLVGPAVCFLNLVKNDLINYTRPLNF